MMVCVTWFLKGKVLLQNSCTYLDVTEGYEIATRMTRLSHQSTALTEHMRIHTETHCQFSQ